MESMLEQVLMLIDTPDSAPKVEKNYNFRKVKPLCLNNL